MGESSRGDENDQRFLVPGGNKTKGSIDLLHIREVYIRSTKFESKLSNIELMSAKTDRGYKNERTKICIV